MREMEGRGRGEEGGGPCYPVGLTSGLFGDGKKMYQSSFHSAIVCLDIHRHAFLLPPVDILVFVLIIPLYNGHVDVDCPITGNHTEVLPVFVFGDWSQEGCGYNESGIDDPCTFDTPIFSDNGNKVTWRWR